MSFPRGDAPGLTGIGEPGMVADGPPWILGWRGAPLEAPENTIASFLRALNGGLDGLHYDLRACVGGDAVVMRDARLERTTDGFGPLEERSLSELFGLDAGGWFSKAFGGEPLPHFDDVLDLHGARREAPLHCIELHDGELIPELARRVEGIHPPLALRVASIRREVCLDLRDAGLGSLLIAKEAEERDLAFVRDERLDGLAVTSPRGWFTKAGTGTWPCERWILGIGEAQDLFDAMGAGVHGLTTSEGRRAIALRTLGALVEGELEQPPLSVGPLPIETSSLGETAGEWRGEWSPRVRLFNPLPFDCRVSVQLYVRKGAFECAGLPRSLELPAGAEDSLHFELRGGSWSPGGDPLVAALFEWEAGPGRAAGNLLFDVALRRERRAVADVITQRLEMLRESPGEARASMTLRRRAGRLAVQVENPGGLADLRCVARLAGQEFFGGHGLQLPLPDGFDDLAEGVEFSCGFFGIEPGGQAERLRRWCGGLPGHPGQGGAGRLFARRFG